MVVRGFLRKQSRIERKTRRTGKRIAKKAKLAQSSIRLKNLQETETQIDKLTGASQARERRKKIAKRIGTRAVGRGSIGLAKGVQRTAQASVTQGKRVKPQQIRIPERDRSPFSMIARPTFTREEAEEVVDRVNGSQGRTSREVFGDDELERMLR